MNKPFPLIGVIIYLNSDANSKALKKRGFDISIAIKIYYNPY